MRFLAGIMAMLAASSGGLAGPPREVVVSSVVPSGPALRLSLAEPEGGARPGDAATLYYQAALGVSLSGTDLQTLTDFIADRGPARRVDLATQLLERERDVLELVELASAMGVCTWGTPVGAMGGSVRVPEAGRLRQLGMLLSARARVQMLAGDLDASVRTIGAGLRMARHIGAGPTIVQAIVGLSLGEAMCDELERLMTDERGPSMYWGLAGLGPTPIDLRAALAGERHLVSDGGISLEGVAAGRIDPARAIAALRPRVYGGEAARGAGFRWAGMAASTYQRARGTMLKRGHTPAEVAALPVSYVSLWYRVDRYVTLRDELFAWASLSYSDGLTGLTVAQERAARAQREDPDELLGSLPDLLTFRRRWALVEQRFAMVRAVEALRLYSGAHAGEPPSTLDAPGVLPVSPDPMTGQALGYRVLPGGTIVLTSGSGPEGGGDTVEWNVLLRRAGAR